MSHKLNLLFLMLTVQLVTASGFAAESINQLSEQVSAQLISLTEKQIVPQERLELIKKTKDAASDEFAKLNASQKIDHREIYNSNSKTSFVLKAIYGLDKFDMIELDPATRKPIDDTCELVSATLSVARTTPEGKLPETEVDKQILKILKALCQP